MSKHLGLSKLGTVVAVLVTNKLRGPAGKCLIVIAQRPNGLFDAFYSDLTASFLRIVQDANDPSCETMEDAIERAQVWDTAARLLPTPRSAEQEFTVSLCQQVPCLGRESQETDTPVACLPLRKCRYSGHIRDNVPAVEVQSGTILVNRAYWLFLISRGEAEVGITDSDVAFLK